MKHNVIGMDIAKNVFQVHAVDARSGEIERIKLRRNEVIQFFTNRDRSLVAMEACGGGIGGLDSLFKWGTRFVSCQQRQFARLSYVIRPMRLTRGLSGQPFSGLK